MFAADQYQLLDFGEGRKLERFGPYLLDRPAPAAQSPGRAQRSLWSRADACYQRATGQQGQWRCRGKLPAQWTITHPTVQGQMRLQIKRTEHGQVGVFPEQAENWDWIGQQLAAAGRPLKMLNLFAYTGGSTLAAVAAGAEVVHVDAARNVVGWARDNAKLSALAEAPVRWIVDDVRQFVRRELRRANRYDAVVLDPPSYGHGPKGQAWKLDQHLLPLLADCVRLMADRRTFLLVTCHTPGYDPARLRALLAEALGEQGRGSLTAGRLALCTAGGRRLASGVVARWGPAKK